MISIIIIAILSSLIVTFVVARKYEGEINARRVEDLTKEVKSFEESLYFQIEANSKLLSQKKSSEVRLGFIAEKLAPFLDNFPVDPGEVQFLGNPIDYIGFLKDHIALIEIKSGKSKLSKKQRNIRNLVEKKAIKFYLVDIDGDPPIMEEVTAESTRLD